MATSEEQQSAASSSPLLLIGLLGLSATSAFALGRVFHGSGAGLRLALAAVVAVLLARLTERRHILLATLLSAAALLVTLGLMVFASSTRFLLPTLTTFHEMSQALRAISRTASTEVAPALPLPPLMLAAVTAVWTSSFAAHALAARSRSPLLGMLPPGALLAFGNLILDDAGRPLLVIFFLSSALLVLYSDGAWRIQRWGPVSAWRARRRQAWAPGPGSRSARRVGLACLGIALFFPWLLPGFRAGGLVRAQSDQAGVGISADPIVDIRPQLRLDPAIDLFTVQSNHPAYWRLLSLDSFDGTVWRSSREDPSNTAVTQGDLPGAPFDPSAVAIQQTVTLQRLSSPFLPVAYRPIAIDIPETSVRYDEESSLVVAPSGTSSGYEYRVVSKEEQPSADQLDAVASVPAPDHRYLALPRKTPQQLSTIAHSIADPFGTRFQKILAIQNFLKDGFGYDLNPPKVPSGQNPLLYFLTKSKTGYCVQFAGTMAVLLRELGIPTRVALGYTQGDEKRPGLWQVTTSNAHTWVESFFPGYGWVAFDPTPGRFNPGSKPYLAASLAATKGDQVQPECVGPAGGVQRDRCTSGGATKGRGESASPTPPPHPRVNPGRGTNGVATGRTVSWKFRLAEWLLALIGLAGLLIPAAKAVQRRVALARARDPRQQVLASYRILAAEAADVGLGRRPHETLREYRTRLGGRVESLDGELDRFVLVASRAAYSADPISSLQARRAAQEARAAARQIRGSVGLPRRVVGWFRLERPSWRTSAG